MLLGASSMALASNKVTFRFAVVEHIMGGLMANSEQSQTISQEILAFEEEHSTGVGESAVTVGRRVGFWSHFFTHEWASAALYLLLDVVTWLAIYRLVGWFRYDAFYATPFQFFIVNLIQLGVIVAALYFIGGGRDAAGERYLLDAAANNSFPLSPRGGRGGAVFFFTPIPYKHKARP